MFATNSATLRQVSGSNAFVLDQVDAGMLGDPILKSIDVTIPEAGITVLAGPSGAGKSTLLRLLNRLDDPLGGAIRWRDRDLSEWDPMELRRRVGMVFQRPPLFHGTVLENLQVALPDVSNERALHVLEHVGLSGDLLDQDADTLSGGEAQRMCVARALLTEPEVLLADEPTAALDAAARRKVEGLGRMLADSGVAVVWVSHDTDQLRRLADHVIVLADGAIRATGTLAELDESGDSIIRQSVGAP
jgi:putative ABC transport system ATP-binding protein